MAGPLAKVAAGLICDKTRRSRIPPLSAEVQANVVAATQTAPPGETTRWTSGAMARHAAISVRSVQRISRKHGLQPHRTRLFKLSSDPQVAEKLTTIVGRYVAPPDWEAPQLLPMSIPTPNTSAPPNAT
jgi:hypothetical protein